MDNTILIYMIKVSVALILFYGVHMLFLRGDTFLKLRRFYFLFALLFSLIYPLLSFEVSIPSETQIPTYWLSEIEVGSQPSATGQSMLWKTENVLLVVMAIISLILAVRFLVQLFSIAKLKGNNDSVDLGGCRIVKLKDKEIKPFSFFKWIFISSAQNSRSELNEIIAHEQIHAKQFHSIDVLLSELFCICFWWNPFAWLLKREIKINLEYLADQGVLNEGFDSRAYQYLLLQTSTENTGISFINHFNVSQLKKRITMMNKQKSSLMMSVKYLLIIPVGVSLLLANAVQASPALIDFYADEVTEVKDIPQDTKTKKVGVQSLREGDASDQNPKPFIQVEQMPQYTGGEQAMHKFIADNLKYPVEAFKNGVEGRVTVRFVVGKEGKISDVTVVRGIDPTCDKEAVRVVNLMPDWVPGKQNGQAVPVYFTLPIVFRLKKDDTATNVSPAKGETVVESRANSNEKTAPQLNAIKNALFIIDGEIVDQSVVNALDPTKIESVSVLKAESAAKAYGDAAKGKDGVIVIELQK